MLLNIQNFIKPVKETQIGFNYKLDIQNIDIFFQYALTNNINFIINKLENENNLELFYKNNELIIKNNNVKFYSFNNDINLKKYNFNLITSENKNFFIILDFHPNLIISENDLLNIKKYFFNYKLFVDKKHYLPSLDIKTIKEYVINYVNKNKNDILLSIVTVVNNYNQYKEFLKYLKKQIIDIQDKIEIIPIFNYENVFTNIAEPLNYGINISSGSYIMLCHQDIIFYNPLWFKKFKNVLKKIPPNWGVLGFAGITDKNEPIIYLNNGNIYKYFYKKYGELKEVQTLDELCLIIKNQKSNNKQLYFDEKCIDDFHFYGLDICLQSLLEGYKNYAINVGCYHLSNGISNISTENSYNRFCKSAIKVYKKWIDKYPVIYTTTTEMIKENKEIIFTIIKNNKNKFSNFTFSEKILVND